MKSDSKKPSNSKSVYSLMAANFFLADVQNGLGPFVALFLQAGVHWNPAQIGTALACGNISQVIAQTPLGNLIDQSRKKRELLLVGILLIVSASLATAWFNSLVVVSFAQALIGIAGAIFPPCLAAIALGLVGRRKMDCQMGINQGFNAGGNMLSALLIGLAGYYFGLSWMFYLLVILGGISCFFVLQIRPDDIDFDLARGADGDSTSESFKKAAGVWEGQKHLLGDLFHLLRQRAVFIFFISTIIFHFANAAMVPLVTEMLSKNQGAKTAIIYTSGYMVASQAVFMIVATVSGGLASKIGRKPLFLFAFTVLAARGYLYTLSNNPICLITVQCLDGLGAGVFGVVSVLIIADLTRGTGRFNSAQGALAAATGIGAFLSNSLAGLLAKQAGTSITFDALALIALAGLAFFWALMPETLDIQNERVPTDLVTAYAFLQGVISQFAVNNAKNRRKEQPLSS